MPVLGVFGLESGWGLTLISDADGVVVRSRILEVATEDKRRGWINEDELTQCRVVAWMLNQRV